VLSPSPERPSRAIASLCAAIVGLAGLAAAWISDDGMVTLRTVENLVAGDGFTWNIAERTQTATHPLWILVLSAARFVTGEMFLTTIAVSLLCTTLAAWLIARNARSTVTALVTVPFAMLMSRTAIQYSTGGLENPLVYLLIACFAVVWFDSPAAATTAPQE